MAGHVGIVVNPAQRVFFSRLRSGPGVDAYDADYWKERGQVRFYRYIKVPSPRGEDDGPPAPQVRSTMNRISKHPCRLSCVHS